MILPGWVIVVVPPIVFGVAAYSVDLPVVAATLIGVIYGVEFLRRSEPVRK